MEDGRITKLIKRNRRDSRVFCRFATSNLPEFSSNSGELVNAARSQPPILTLLQTTASLKG